MRNRTRRGGAAILLLVLVSCGAAPSRSGSARPGFDADRAFRDLVRQVDFGPRAPGHPGHESTRLWLVESLRPLALRVEEDHFSASGVDLTNIVARLAPDTPDRVMLFAHWDTRPRAEHDPDPGKRATPIPGANDGASGVAVLLELGRMFHAVPPAVGVDLVFLDGEDYGTFEPSLRSVLLGSQRFALSYRGPRPRFGILLDMVGDRHLSIPQERGSLACCKRTMERIWQVARELGHDDVFVALPGSEVLDDHVPLNRAGLGVVDLIDLDYASWHTTADTPEQTSPRSLAVVGEVVAEVIYREPAKR